MKPRKKPSKVTSTSAGKENVEMGYRESEPPAKRQRKTAGTPSQINPRYKKVKESIAKTARWKPLPQSARDYIAATVDIAVYNSLAQKGSKSDASQEHLSQLRQRFLDRCSSIQAPVSNLKDLKNIKKSCASQEEHLREDEASLKMLQNELDKTLDTLERNSEEVEKLQDEISRLRAFLDETENDEFQEKLMGIGNRDALLQDLQTIQRSPAMQNLLTFLEYAHAEADGVSPIGHGN
ncbi:centromere protein Q-like isoform X2 [Scyliorhinus canicula]|uniref:centromere protein Q-like isoform X2 n=1 Tax=Scyliorhinus canicula TaxID=7830 RepID=UPI0018F65226|nr:centromere protein Q-like isoform X2 [Scyliorhinus canicula]